MWVPFFLTSLKKKKKKLQHSIAIPQDHKQRICTFLMLKGSIYLCKGDYNVVIIFSWQIKLQCLS